MPLTLNRTAFLTMLSVSEGTSTNALTRNDGYDVIVTGVAGPAVFTDYSDHPFAHGRPPQVINAATGLRSTAAGRYQVMLANWLVYRRQLNLPDFGSASQDAIALQLIRECSALPLIDGGSFADAVYACRSRWASLPGANYPGQHMNSLDALRAAYLLAGGTEA